METTLGTRSALRIIGICGLVGILVDLDHIISLFIWKFTSIPISEGRIWHTPIFIISCIGICYLGAHLPRLYAKLVLGGVIVFTVLVLIFSPEVIWGIK